MESVVQENPATERSMVEAPTVESIEAPREGLQEQYEERQDQQEPVSAIDAPPTSTSLQEGPEQGVGPAAAKDSTTTESARGGAAGKGKGRGGGRSASTASAKGKGASAGKGTAARGGGKAGASTSARGGAKGGRASTSKGGAKGGKGSAAAKSKDLSSNNAEGSGNGSIEGTSGIGSGPSNTIFPLARVSRIVKVDKEIEMTSKDAIWTIAVATELFIKHLTDSAYAKARLDKKKTITFKELSSAVESQNEFFFLQDIIPQPIPFSKALEMRQIVEEKNHLREAGIYDDEEEEVDDAAPLINQTMGDESEDIAATTAEEVVAMPPVDKADEQGDMATDEDLPPPAALLNGHSESQAPLLNGNRDEEMMI